MRGRWRGKPKTTPDFPKIGDHQKLTGKLLVEGEWRSKKRKSVALRYEVGRRGREGERDGEAFVVFVRMGGEEIGGGGDGQASG